MFCIFMLGLNSTVSQQPIKKKVREFLLGVQTIYSDMRFVEFSDEFLKQNVKCISIVDTDYILKAAQVGRSILFSALLLNHI